MSENKTKMPSIPVIFLGLIIVGALIAGAYLLFSKDTGNTYEGENIVIVEDSGMLIDFDRDGHMDYVKYIYAEVVFGGEDTNFQTGTGE